MRLPFDHFNLIAPIYERVISHINLDMLRSLLNLPLDGRLLDVGGGTGRVSALLGDNVKQTILVDLSRGMLRQAKSKNCLQPAIARAERLPFPSGSLDRILMVDAFHHIADQQGTVRELVRVLKLGGRMVLEEPNIETWPVKLIALGEKLLFMQSRFVHPNVIRRMFEDQGTRVTIHTNPDDDVNVWLAIDKR
jgi:demethylmenaquinone methyltransferase/2-methoxy-6-polyprenyl-1,4-benzoquinol methylase